MEAVYIGIGVALGALIMWALVIKGLQQRASRFEKEASDRQGELSKIQAEITGLRAQAEAKEQSHKEQITELKSMRESAEDAFQLLANKALKENREDFIKSAEKNFEVQREKIEDFVDPLKKQLDDYEQHLKMMQKEHGESSTANRERIGQLMQELGKQQKLATDLKGLLQGPTQRGRVAEMLLESMLERAGLIAGQHFRMQHTIKVNGQTFRPDCQMSMPGYGEIFIDVKAPLDAYKEAIATDDEALSQQKYKEHVRNVRAAIDDIASKPYKDAANGPAIVIMYLPIEASLTAAQLHDPDITTYGWDRGVIVASPTLLFVLLQTVALSWQQERLRENSEEVKKLGTELVTRVRKVAEHMTKVGSRLNSTAEAYNDAVGSIDRMLFTTSRKFQQLGASSDTKDLTLRDSVVEIKQFEKSELLAPPSESEMSALSEIVVDVIDQPELIEAEES